MSDRNLIQKLAAASISVGGKLAADKRNTDQNYDYISADKMLAVAGQALAEAGVMVRPAITAEATEAVVVALKYGDKTRYDSTVEFEMTVTDGITEFTDRWLGRGSDYTVPDKALYKAITSGHKYYIAKLLSIGVGNEDGEHEIPAEDAPAQRNQAPAQRQPAKAPPATPPVQAEVEFNGATEPVMPTEGARKAFHAMGTQLYGAEWDAKRAELVSWVTDKRTTSSKELSAAEMKRLSAGMDAKLAQQDQPDAKAKAAK